MAEEESWGDPDYEEYEPDVDEDVEDEDAPDEDETDTKETEDVDLEELDETDELELEDQIKDPYESDSDAMYFNRMVDRREKSLEVLKQPKRLTKYELTAIIGYRAQQIAEGAPPYIDVRPNMDAISIAIEEYEKNLIPLMIERPFPTSKVGRYKYKSYKLDELINVTQYK
jgi:DNA-directed RNA polymerase subunit K/omega